MTKAKKLKILKAAIRLWIKAEYEFRLGAVAYQPRQTTRLVAAEGLLREALTGTNDLRDAAALSGVNVEGHERVMRRANRKVRKGGGIIG